MVAGCGMIEVESTWKDREVVIDGADNGNEWENARYFFDEAKITLGILNDESHLYIRLSTRGRALQRRVLSKGITLWFDGNGGKKKKLGIRYPLGRQGADGPPQMMSGRPGAIDTTSVASINENMQATLAVLSLNAEIQGSGVKGFTKVSITRMEKQGIITGIGYDKGNLVYELSLPLRSNEDTPYGICDKATETIGIGIEIDAPDIQAFQSEQSSGGSGGMSREPGVGEFGGRGGLDGSGGMGGRGMRRPQSRMRPQIVEPIEMWLKTILIARNE